MPTLQNRIEPAPPVMTWGKAAPVLIVGIVFDALRVFFDLFFLLGPAIAAMACTSSLAGELSKLSFGLFGNGTAALACSAVAGTIGTIAIEITLPFGTIMAMFVGFAGWLVVGFMLLMTNMRLFKEDARSILMLFMSLMVSEIPFVDALPALTITLWRLYHVQIKKDHEQLKAYQKRHAAEITRHRAQEAAQFMQMQQMQEGALQEQAQEEEEEKVAAREEEDTANDTAYQEMLSANDDQYTQDFEKVA